jgi:hypothetical protein
MRKSPSFDPDGYGSQTMSGADLSHYQEELARARNSRTLTLRRTSNAPALGAVRRNSSRYGAITDAAKFPYLSPEKAASALKSEDPAELSEFANQICAAVTAAPRPLKSLVNSAGFSGNFTAALSGAHPPDLLVRLLDALIAVFPLLGPLTDGFVDSNICFTLSEFLASPEPSMVTATIRVLRAICERSAYARDSVLCLEVHTTLIQMALAAAPAPLADDCCGGLLAIFANPEPIEPEILISAVDPLFRVIEIGSTQTVASVLDCFVAMTNQHSALVHSLYDLGMFRKVVELLDIPALVSPTLRLIGNLSVAQPFQLRTMLDAGLVAKLFDELESEHAADVFWVLSNLLEAISALILPLIDEEFVARLLEIIDTSSYDIQKESVFFLSTLVLFSPEADLPRFLEDSVIGVVVNMIGSGVEKVVLRCIDAVGKFVRWLQVHEGGVEKLADTDLMDRLSELLDDEEQPLLAERAQALMAQVRALEAKKAGGG